MADKSRGHKAKKSLGQNFLRDPNICRKIVDSLEPRPDDVIIEIGPGQGALTEHLLAMEKRRLIVIEKDENLADTLAHRWPDLEIRRADALQFPWASQEYRSCKIIGNLPYNIGSKLIWDIVSQVQAMQRAVFMVQHEVALRLTAKPGTKAFGALTAWVNNYCHTSYLFKVPPSVFRPQPRVDSAVVRFNPLPTKDRPDAPERLAALIKVLFQQRRKQISTILKKRWNAEVQAWFEMNGINPGARPENLTPHQFRSLSELF